MSTQISKIAAQHAIFVRSMHDDGYDNAVDRTLPKSAGRWPAWLILALRPRFSMSVPKDVRAIGVTAFRMGFQFGRAEIANR